MSSTGCQEDSEVSARIASEDTGGGTAKPLYPEASGIMWVPVRVCAYHQGSCRGTKGLLCVLTDVLSRPFVRTSPGGCELTLWTRGGGDEKDQRLQVFLQKGACSLIKQISSLLSVCTAAAMMVLKCAWVCSKLLVINLIAIEAACLFIHQLKALLELITGVEMLKHLSFLWELHEMESTYFMLKNISVCLIGPHLFMPPDVLCQGRLSRLLAVSLRV